MEYSSTLYNGIQNVYSGANNTEEARPQSYKKYTLCVCIQNVYFLWCFLVMKSAGVFIVFFV